MATSTYEFDLPVILTAAGAQPTPPDTLRAQELAYVENEDPSITTNLPGLMIEDISSVNVGALVVIDAARVEVLNDLSPNVANVALLGQLGGVYGVNQGGQDNTSVPVQFSGTVGFVIPQGFLVGDGTNVYQVPSGGVIGAGGTSSILTAIAVNSGSWAVAEGSVTQLITSVPAGITLSVTNPSAGTPGSATGESYSSWRTRVCNAGLAASVGTPRFIKTLICELAGLPAYAVSVQQASPGIRVIVVGGDTYQVAYAIFMSVADVSQLVGSAVNPGARDVTVSLNDFPNSYNVLSVASPQQVVTAAATWNTEISDFTGGASFQSLVQQPIADYINSLWPGQGINLMEMNNIFQQAVSSVLPPALLTRLAWSVNINGTPTSPTSGTYLIPGDPESYFYTTPSSITAAQG